LFGTLECSVFYGDGGADPIASEPLIVRVTLLSKLKGFAFWAILLPLLLLRENRARKAPWIFLPYGVWLGVAAGAGVWENVFGGLFHVLVPMSAILAGLFLLGQRSPARNGWLVLLAAILFAALVHGIWIWLAPVEYAFYFAIASAVLFLLVLVALLLTRLCCGRRYGSARISLFLLLAVQLVAMAILSCAAYLMFPGAEMGNRTQMLLGMVVPAALTGLFIYLFLMSFLAIPFSAEFYRARLCGLLKLRRNVPPAF